MTWSEVMGTGGIRLVVPDEESILPTTCSWVKAY